MMAGFFIRVFGAYAFSALFVNSSPSAFICLESNSSFYPTAAFPTPDALRKLRKASPSPA